MKKALFGFILVVGSIHFTFAQVDAGQNTTAIGLGASSTDPVYKFTYQNNLIAHYGIGWFSDTQFVGAPMGYFGGYGGLKFFTEGQPRLYIDATGNIGIGTTTPAYKLDMLGGNISITNNGNNPQYRVVDGSIITKLQSQTVGGTAGAVGTESASDLVILTGNITRMFIQNSTGNVGIGTSSPGGVLQITNNVPYADNPANQLVLANGGYRSSESGGLGIETAGIAYYFTNYNAGGKVYDRTLDIKVRGAADGTFGAGMIRFFANNYTAGSVEREIMRIHGNGNVLIGKTSQVNSAYMLDVAGNIRSNQVVVNTTGADFVFAPTYRLNSLSAVKKYIDRNHHLPAIPSALEMQKNGLNVGDNQVKLLQKVEELTLYLIKKDNEIKKLEKRLEALEKNNAKKKR